MTVTKYRFRSPGMRLRAILFVFLFTIYIHYAATHFSFAQEKGSTSIEIEKSPAVNYPQWMDDKTGRVLFDVKDIVRFDWEKQIFELSRRRAMDLTVLMSEVSQFAVRDKAGLIYRGRFINPNSSIPYNGPTILSNGYYRETIRPPLFGIDPGYPGAMNSKDMRFSPRLKISLANNGVLQPMDPNQPPKPIVPNQSGWYGKKDQLRLLIHVFPETFQIGEKARIHLHVILGKPSKIQADRLEFTIIVKQNENEFFCNTVSDSDLKKDTWKGVYIWESAPWGPVYGAIQAYAKSGPAQIKIQARTMGKDNGSKIIENLEIPLIPITILPGTSEANNTFKVAAVQAISKFADPIHNRRHLEELVRQAAKHGAKVIVLPETAIPGYMSWDIQTTWQVGNRKLTQGLQGISPERFAETVPGDSTKFFGLIAKELAIYLTIPIIEIDPKANKYYNTLVLMGPDGKLLLHYRKLNPWPHAERGWATQGDRGNVYIDTPYGRMGLLICYDINYEPTNLKKLKIDHLLYSIAWVDSKGSDWFTKRLPKIARDNHLNIIGANWTLPTGAKPNWYGYGHSLILNKQGNTLAKVKYNIGEEIIYADLPIPDKTP